MNNTKHGPSLYRSWAVSTYECLYRTIIMVSIIRLSARVRKTMPLEMYLDCTFLDVYKVCFTFLFKKFLQNFHQVLQFTVPTPANIYEKKQIKAHTDARTIDHVIVYPLLGTGWPLCLWKCHMSYLLELLSIEHNRTERAASPASNYAWS